MVGAKHKNVCTGLQVLLLPCDYEFSSMNFIVNKTKTKSSCWQY
jgi:hypothetical protein